MKTYYVRFHRVVSEQEIVTIAVEAKDEALARALASALGTPTLRLYHSTDVLGVEIGAATKNVLAIGCGIAAGRGLGASAGAALIGFKEGAFFPGFGLRTGGGRTNLFSSTTTTSLASTSGL